MSTRKNRTIPWYQLTITEIKKRFETDSTRGLDENIIPKLQERYGKNLFKKGKEITLFSRIIAQLKSPLVIVLMVALVATFLLEHHLDTLVISIALLINVVIGVIQEKRAGDAFEKLVASQEKHATVIRDGEKKEILAEDIVPGDIIWVEPGMSVPADARIISAHGFSANEASLTGEWESVSKREGLIKKDAQITGQTNMLWMGTLVVAGNGKAIVIETGDKTQMGMIASELAGAEEEDIPLQKNIKKLASFFTYVVIVAIIILFFAGIAQGNKPIDMIIVAIAVAVAAMPEGLPAAVTVVLAIGMETTLKKGGLVRNLLAAETLGNTTVIMTDKTGTLTKAQMRVADILTFRSIYNQDKTGRIPLKDALGEHDKKDILSMALFTSEGYVEGTADALGEWVVHGNPVERAIVLAGLESGIRAEDLTAKSKRLDVLPFDSEHRFAASLNHYGSEKSEKSRVYIAGAPELLLECAESVYSEGKKKKLTDSIRELLEARQLAESKTGMRLIGIAYKDVDWKKFDDKDPDFPKIFWGNLCLAALLFYTIQSVQMSRDLSIRRAKPAQRLSCLPATIQ